MLKRILNNEEFVSIVNALTVVPAELTSRISLKATVKVTSVLAKLATGLVVLIVVVTAVGADKGNE